MSEHMVTITARQAVQLLSRTARNNATGRIGSPYAVAGYDLPSALALLPRARPEKFRRGTHHGQDTVWAYLDGFGWHAWYLNLQVRKEDPWAT